MKIKLSELVKTFSVENIGIYFGSPKRRQQIKKKNYGFCNLGVANTITILKLQFIY